LGGAAVAGAAVVLVDLSTVMLMRSPA